MKTLTEANKIALDAKYLPGARRNFTQFESLCSNDVVGEFRSVGTHPGGQAQTGGIVEIGEYATLPDTIEQLRNTAHSLLETVEKHNKFRDFLDEQALLDLPIGLKKTIGNIEYVIMIKEMVITEEGAFLETYMSFTLPGEDKKIAFRGAGIRFTADGGVGEEARMELLGEYDIRLSPNFSLLLKEGSFISWDCDGFKGFGINAQVNFSREWLIPVDERGNQLPGQVVGEIATSLESWDDFIAQVSLNRFQVNGLPDVSFKVSTAVFDFSDLRNPPALDFPSNYPAQLHPANPNLWKGVYLRELEVTLPSYFNKKEEGGSREGKPSRLVISNAIIDRAGFTGLVTKEQLLTLEQGRMGKWAFSLDVLSLKIEANNLAGAAFSGGLIIPAFDEEKPFGYAATIYPDNEYVFAVSSPKDLSFSLLNAAQVNLRQGSKIEVRTKDKEFVPRAILHGSMAIGGGSDSKLKVGEITFEGLELQTVTPYVRIAALSLGVGKKNGLGNFPLQINNFGIESPSDHEIGLRFDITISLTGGDEDKNSFGATGGLVLMGRIEEGSGENAKQRWRYDRLEVRKLGVAVDAGALKIRGSLEWYKDNPTYGDGIRGEVDLTVIETISVSAVALFGAKDGERYWFVDVLADVNIPIFSGLKLSQMGGGAIRRMRQSTDGGSYLGQTLSGLTYVPDKDMGMEFSAFIKIATMGSEAIFNGEVQFRIAFNRHGGLDMVAFRGQAAFINPMAALSIPGLKGKAASLVEGGVKSILPVGAMIEASMSMLYDVPAKTFHANMEVYVNIAGGLVRGVGERNRAGWSVIHFSPGEWYIHVGSPDDPVGLEFLRIAKTESYFMMGHNIPGSPPPPKEVSEILGGIDLDYMASLNDLGEGKGIAFGARFSINTGDMTFLMFYASFKAGMGFDVMLKDYGDAQCKGLGPLGVNGWYANGQSFAYMEGAIGINLRIFRKKKKFEILSISAAVVLQAKLPNPTWMRGIVGGEFSVLGGMVKGNCSFEVTIGKECELIRSGSVLENLEVITDFSPKEGDRDVDVFSAPQVVFSMPVDQAFSMVDYDDQKKTYRVKLNYVELRSEGKLLKGRYEWNDRHDVVAFNIHEVLPPQQKVEVKVKITFEQLVSGSWQTVVVDKEPLSEEKQVSFTTGEAPDYIPMHNVELLYPMPNQYNYYPKQTGKGFIKLIRGQAYLFESPEFKATGRFKSLSGSVALFNVSYDERARQVNFNLPQNLINSSIYALEIVNVPIAENEAIDVNVKESIATANLEDENMLETRSQTAEGTIKRIDEKNIINFHLRTSQYNSFTEKINAFSFSRGWNWSIRTGVYELGSTGIGSEYFDDYEIKGNERYGVKPLIYFTADLDGNEYYIKDMYPLVYKDYPFDGFSIKWRNPQELGVVPVKGILMRQNIYNVLLEPSDITRGTPMKSWEKSAVIYNLSHYYNKDFYELQLNVAAKFSRTGTLNRRSMDILTTSFPKLRKGDYKLKIGYLLPGQENPMIIKSMSIHNPFD